PPRGVRSHRLRAHKLRHETSRRGSAAKDHGVDFYLRVSGYDAGGAYVFKNPHHILYNFAFSLKRRGNKRALATGGDCLGGKTADCVVDCDGGGIMIDKLPSGEGLSISLPSSGSPLGCAYHPTTPTTGRPRPDHH